MSKLKWIILGIVVCLLFVTILFCVKRKEDHFDKFGKENLHEGLHIPSLNRRNTNIQSKRGGGGGDSVRGSLRKGGSQSGKTIGDFVLVNNEKGTFGLPDLMKAANEVLKNRVLGLAYKAKWYHFYKDYLISQWSGDYPNILQGIHLNNDGVGEVPKAHRITILPNGLEISMN
ncbi:Pollen receptor-like kinase 3 [Datura stramonium]|uniref:Pollen receptor-like kinase 3 n=1 Tax=Datura stramonium TaxID=4076 RepID=A0ABS8T524_DATST|nr:Pollen receptor-like kinase 3 [Datura stramonium]